MKGTFMKKNITEENIFMEKHIDSVLSLEWKPVPGGVVYLPSIVKYKDKQSIAQALLDDDFCNKTLAMVASAVLKKDDQERKLSLSALQLYCNY